MVPDRDEDVALPDACVLLVEDEVVVRALLADELRAAALTVIEAANADEAWAYLQSGGRADLMLSDVRMPGSMDGIELRRRVRAEFPAIKIVITSGNVGPVIPGEVDAFLPKPYSFTKAVDIVLHLIGGESRDG
jgi:CheY-like chemotaxis protein